MSPATLREIQNTLTDLRANGGVHLLVYCINALHSTKWIHEIHRTIVPYPTPSPRIPAVAVVTGMSDVAQQESWWSNNEDALAEQGPRFDDHAFIRVMITGAQSPTGDHISESRHVLHALILQNCAFAFNSETNSDFQRTAPYKQRAMGNPSPSLSTMLAGKPFSLTSTRSKAIDIVLLGEAKPHSSPLIGPPAIPPVGIEEQAAREPVCQIVSHSNPRELETGSQDDDASLLDVRIGMIPPEDASLMMVTDRVSPKHICPII